MSIKYVGSKETLYVLRIENIKDRLIKFTIYFLGATKYQ
jgi:hypothetical protein